MNENVPQQTPEENLPPPLPLPTTLHTAPASLRGAEQQGLSPNKSTGDSLPECEAPCLFLVVEVVM